MVPLIYCNGLYRLLLRLLLLPVNWGNIGIMEKKMETTTMGMIVLIDGTDCFPNIHRTIAHVSLSLSEAQILRPPPPLTALLSINAIQQGNNRLFWPYNDCHGSFLHITHKSEEETKIQLREMYDRIVPCKGTAWFGHC